MWGSQAFNQWALQPAMFNDVPHEQIDWAALAKQWIEMQHTQPGEEETPPPLPLSEKFPSENVALLKTPPPPEPLYHPKPPETERRHFSPVESDDFVPKVADDPYWKNDNWDARPPVNEMDDRMWAPPPPPPPPIAPTLPSMLPGKTTFDYGHMHDNPPLAMQTVDYNHVSEYSYSPIYTPPESHYDQYWSQVNVAPPTISPMFLKKERISSNRVEEETSHIDAAKRKQLPGWIREGLEKMEQERLKRLEKERADKEKAEELSKASSMRKISSLLKAEDSSAAILPLKSKFESDSELEDESESLPSKETQHRSSPVIEDSRTEEEKKHDLMLKVRRLLTEVLLSVTNAEILSIAQEVYRKAVAKAPARQLATSTSLSAVASGLGGLASYGSESDEASSQEEESDSDEDLLQRIREKRRQFAIKERRILEELERQELEEKEAVEAAKNETIARNSNKDDQENDSELPSSPPKASLEVDNLSNCEKPTIQPEEEPPQLETEPEAVKTPMNEIPGKLSDDKFSDSDSDSSSSTSGSNSDTNHRKTKKSSKDKKDHRKRRMSSGSRKDEKKRKRSHSRDSNVSDRHSRNKHKSRIKRSKRSESSNSSSSRRKLHDHQKKERSHSRKRDRRSRSNSSSRYYRGNKSSSYSRRDKYEKRRHHNRRSDSPSSSRMPKKHRTHSRSPSSEYDSSGKKSKTKSRNQ